MRALPAWPFYKSKTLLEGFLDGDGAREGRADHGVVAHADEAHHLDVRGDGGASGELRVAVHASHRVGEAVGSRAGRHVVGMQGAAGAAARGHREVLDVILVGPFLIGARDQVLEAGRVGGVAGDRDVDLLGDQSPFVSAESVSSMPKKAAA